MSLPIFDAIFRRNSDALVRLVSQKDCNLDVFDKNGNTPLLLALKLGYPEIALILLRKGVPLNYLSENCFTVMDEALLSCREYEVIRQIYAQMKTIMLEKWTTIIEPGLLHSLPNIIDCHLSIKMKFQANFVLNSLVQYLTPSETYKIWKKGNMLRVDFTLKGVNKDFSVRRGNVSLILKLEQGRYRLLKVDHDKKSIRDLLSQWRDPSELKLRMFILNMMTEMSERKKVDAFRFKVENMVIQRSKTLFGKTRSEQLPEGWKCDLWDIKGKVQVFMKSKSENTESRMSYSEYFGEMLDPSSKGDCDRFVTYPCSTAQNDESIRSAIFGDESFGTTLLNRNMTSTLWMTDDVPLRVSDLLPILQVIGIQDNNISYFEEILTKYQEVHSQGCPVKLTVPLLLGVQATATFLDFSTDNINEDLFVIPSYEYKQ